MQQEENKLAMVHDPICDKTEHPTVEQLQAALKTAAGPLSLR